MNKIIHHIVLSRSEKSLPGCFVVELDLAVKHFSRMVPGHDFIVHVNHEAYMEHLAKLGTPLDNKPADYEHYGHIDELELVFKDPVIGSLQAPSGVHAQ
jgi:hypothetical protein